ncbi:substrate-binding domain-containing protein [Streptomyces jeddahensis]|uniref:D-ribose-binding periplasmic protein n=1 Tax=Streptomyces jeddahensis TaxID=1716141 RepID=A0A177HTJ2_9ACTN|nr:substrate-binding domain-containing protein [Streptomyces jeddahensis]OAH14036.1 D-ribose-binding periplasmic protein precursor [Streptomyces jeddahensis]
MGPDHTDREHRTSRERTRQQRTGQQRRRHGAALLAVVALLLGAVACGGGQDDTGGRTDDKVTIGLVTKTETNPFFVTMREAAAAAAEKHGAELIALAGRFDGDNEGQVAAIESLVSRGANGILITPSNTTGILEAIEDARRQGILVIALDTATDPPDAVDATFATDNVEAGRLQGAYLRAVLGDRAPKVIMLDGTQGSSVSRQRHDGFLKGFELTEDSPAIVGRADTQADSNTAQAALENLLQRASDVNTIYTINEPVAGGAYAAVAARGLTQQVSIGSIDGGCAGVRDVQAGKYAATVMQFPVRMADDGVAAVVEFAKSGKKPSGFTHTGTVLITDKPVAGLKSQNTAWGLERCWG